MTDLHLVAVLSLPAAASVLVLPGFALQELFARGSRWLMSGPRWPQRLFGPQSERGALPRSAPLVLALAASLCYVVVVGSALLALGLFTPTRLAACTGVAALLGIVPFLRWARHTKDLLFYIPLLAVVVAPQVPPVVTPGFAPAYTYQWFYWNLGNQLAKAHGVPSYVLEWSSATRWQPDYVNFSLISQAYLGTMRGVDAPAVAASWKLPLAAVTFAMLFLLLRLWFGRTAAGVVTAGLSVSTLSLAKVGNNTPEALGLAFGLVAVWLAVQALRARRPEMLVLAATTLALAVSVHAIAATVCGFLLVAACLIEWFRLNESRARWGAALAGGALVWGVVVSALGLAIQGRASPLGGAANPRVVDGSDPTLRFLEYSNGHFDPAEWSISDDAWQTIRTPWPGVDLATRHWSWLVGIMVVGSLATLLMRSGRARRGVLAALGLAGLLVLSGLWFALHYHTFIPQHTGKSRLADYAPLAYGFFLAAAVDTAAAALSRWAKPAMRRWADPAMQPRTKPHALLRVGVPAVLVVAVVLVGAPLPRNRQDAVPGISAVGLQALSTLRHTAPAGSVVVNNVATRGTVEYFTGLENPLEGRQPVIEDLATLESASDYLHRLDLFLTDPHPGELERSLHADWILLTSRPAVFGLRLYYGLPGRAFARHAGLDVVWRKDGVQILRSPTATFTVSSVGPRKSLWLGYLLYVFGAFAVCVLVLAGIRKVVTTRTGADRSDGADLAALHRSHVESES